MHDLIILYILAKKSDTTYDLIIYCMLAKKPDKESLGKQYFDY